MWIFLVQICEYTHFCFSELWFWEEKGSRSFFCAIGVPKKIKNFQRILKTHHTAYRRVTQKKGQLLTRDAANHTFFTHSVVFFNMVTKMQSKSFKFHVKKSLISKYEKLLRFCHKLKGGRGGDTCQKINFPSF